MLDRRALLAQIEYFVHLFLVFGQRETRARLMNEVANFIEGCIGEGRHRVPTEGASGQHPRVEPRAVVAQHQHDVARLEIQFFETSGAAKHDLEQLLPRRLIPDALVFLAHRDTIGKDFGILRQNADQRGIGFEIPGQGRFSARHAHPRCMPRSPLGRRRRRPARRCRSFRHSSTPACDRKCP